MPHNKTPTFSPTALKHYFKYPKLTTHHLSHLTIITPCHKTITFPSTPTFMNNKVLDYHSFEIIKPIDNNTIQLPQPSIYKAISPELLLQCLAHHCNHRKIDRMCHQNKLLGLPKTPLPHTTQECPICLMSKFQHPPKGKTTDTTNLAPGVLLYIDFTSWDIPSRCGFTSILIIVDAKTRML